LIAGALALVATDAFAGPVEIKARNRRSVGPGPGPDAARAYAEAKRRLERGRPNEALEILAANRSPLIEDREALVRGDALLALGHADLAKAAYVDALKHAQLRSIAVAAVRGLIHVHGQLGQPAAQLKYVDALLAEASVRRRSSLMLERASLLAKLGRNDDAASTAWRILVDFPTAKVTGQAEAILKKLAKKGVARPKTPPKVELGRVRNLTSAGAYRRATAALDALAKSAPQLSTQIAMERSAILKRQRKKDEELRVLQSLEGKKLTKRVGLSVLERLGRLAMSRDDNTKAIKYFDLLASRYPKSKKAADVQYLASWLNYNDGHYAKAAGALVSFADRYDDWHRRPEALWFAGWSAYLAKKDKQALAIFDKLLAEHKSSEMKLWAHYWSGRVHERNKRAKIARRAYREVLRIAPLSYFGHWAMTALDRLGEETVLDPPPNTKPASIAKALKVLGSSRPMNVDRGIALAAVELKAEALEELRGASVTLRKVRDTKGRVMVAEMINQLGGYHHAFRLAARITRDGGDLVTGNDYAWRAWRLAYPRAFKQDVENAAATHNVDPHLVLSIMRTESSFRPWVRSPVGARGLMQVMPKTAKAIGRKAKGGRAHAARYTRPASNIWLGTWYLRKLLDRYHGQLPLAVGAYNAGPGAMDRWLAAHHGKTMDEFVEALSYRETRRYIRRVVETYQTYRRLEGLERLKLAGKVRREAPPYGAVAF